MTALTINAPRSTDATRNVIEGVILGALVTALSYAVGVGFGWVTSLNPLEVFAVFTSYVCTYLCVRERRINYPIGAVSTAAYAVLFFQQDLLASALLNLSLTPYLVYGWIRWRNDDVARPVTTTKLKWLPVYAIVTAAAYFFSVWVLGLAGGALAWSDAIILVGTILAQFLLDNKKLENWIIWAIVNVFAVYTYFNAGLPLAGFQYVFFFANTFYGFYTWKQSRSRAL